MRTHTLAAATLTVLALTGCSTADNPPSTPSDKSGTDASTATSPEAEFLANAKAADFDSWKTTAPSDDELTAYPTQWCAELRTGHSVAYILDDATLYPIGEKWGTAKPDAQELVVLGVKAYCPEFGDQVTEELRLSGQY